MSKISSSNIYHVLYVFIFSFIINGGFSFDDQDYSREIHSKNELELSQNTFGFNLYPQKINNKGLLIKKGDRSPISSSDLKYIDPEGTTITYTLIDLPIYGYLILEGKSLSDENKAFSQPDIDAGRLYYHHRFGNLTDHFNFSVKDADSLTTGPDIFNIMIEPFIPGERIYVDLNAPGPIHDGTSWGNAMLNIQDGVMDAAFFKLSEVWVADGTYVETILIGYGARLGVYGGFEGYGGEEETELDQRDWKNHPTIINPNYGKIPHENKRVVLVEDVEDFRFDGFTITGGKVIKAEINGGSGLACINLKGQNKVANCIIKKNLSLGNNEAGSSAGGILVFNSNVTFESCVISDNFSSASEYLNITNIKGPNVSGGGGGFLYSSLSFNNCSITSNTCLAGYGKGYIDRGGDAFGGGLYFDSCHVSITNTNITGNAIFGGNAEGNSPNGGNAFGGGIYLTSGTLQLHDCIIEANRAKGGDALGIGSASGGWTYSGGIYSSALSNDWANCLIADNIALGGDAILLPGEDQEIVSGGTFAGGVTFLSLNNQIKNCRFISNEVIGGKTVFTGDVQMTREGGLGGGGFIFTGDKTTIENCIVSGNKVIRMGVAKANPGYGGGMLWESMGEVKITNCVISANFSTDAGGGLLDFLSDAGTTITIQNCTVSSNASKLGGGLVTGMGLYFLKNCIFENNENYAIFESYDLVKPLVSNCLFHNNPNGDYFGFYSFPFPISGAHDINNMPNATGNVDGDPLFVMDSSRGITGTWTNVEYDSINNVTILTNSAANFSPGKLSGKVIQPDTNRRMQTHVIINDAKSLRVWGNQTLVVQPGDRYNVVDYRLSSKDSAALDQGAPEGAPPFDINGRTRPFDFPGIGRDGAGEGFDIGAYEFQTFNNNGLLIY